jgi:hypothetical protein
VSAARAGRALVSVVIVFAAYGWLDVLRHLPGPHLPLVLPLRGNGNADDVSLATVIIVCVTSFLAIARVATPRRLVLAVLVRAALFGAFVIAVVALQEGIVEQSQPSFAWSSAIWLIWPWLAIACSALGTWIGAPRRRERTAAAVAVPVSAPISEPSEPRALEASVA